MVTIPSPGRPAVTVPKAARALAIQVCGPGLSHCDWQAAGSRAESLRLGPRNLSESGEPIIMMVKVAGRSGAAAAAAPPAVGPRPPGGFKLARP